MVCQESQAVGACLLERYSHHAGGGVAHTHGTRPGDLTPMRFAVR